MKIKFLGAAGGVTGSKTVLEVDKELYLIDYGLFQGSSEARERNWHHFARASEVKAVFLTHAHIDHSGLLPRLWKDGFRGEIYCSEETFKLCSILLMDSAKIQREDAEYANKKQYSRHKPALALYTEDEAEAVLELFKPVKFDKCINLTDHVAFSFHWAGHILGSSFLELSLSNEKGVKKTIVFSGDIGHSRNVLLKAPAKLCKADILVLESTYGNKLHSRIDAKKMLEIFLTSIIKRGGVAIIPSFSVGRTQDVLYLIKQLIDEKRIKRVPVFLDSPLSKKANEIFNESFASEQIKEDVLRDGTIYPDTLKVSETVNDSKSINFKDGPMIILSASGMMEGGRVIHHVKRRISDKKNGIILVGFQPVGTKGRLLLDGIKMLRLHKEELDVAASVFYVNALSAHADYLDTLEWLGNAESKPGFIILNHGEEMAAKNLKIILETQVGVKTTIADFDEEFYLESL